MRRDGGGDRGSGMGPINRTRHHNDSEAGSDRRIHGRLRFLRDEATLHTCPTFRQSDYLTGEGRRHARRNEQGR